MIICRSLEVKKNIVEKDEKETSLRAILNFGHTIGHAIESLHMDKWYHGECVALGMIPMIENDEIRNRVKYVFKRLGLKDQITDNPDELYEIMTHDKKADKETITVVKVSTIGNAELIKITYPQLKKLVEEASQ